MKPAHALWLLALSIACSGCALAEDISRNLHVAFSTPVEVHREKARNEKWAEAAWQAQRSSDVPHSPDFAQGFKDGYAEFLFRGGDGEPPIVAPLHYRNIRYQNPAGYQAIQDWFDGYRLGAATARDSGARQWITGPSSMQKGAHDVAAPGGVPVVPDLPLMPPLPEARNPLPQPRVLPQKQQNQNLQTNMPKVPALDGRVDGRVDGLSRFFASSNVTAPAEPDRPKVKILDVHVAPLTPDSGAHRLIADPALVPMAPQDTNVLRGPAFFPELPLPRLEELNPPPPAHRLPEDMAPPGRTTPADADLVPPRSSAQPNAGAAEPDMKLKITNVRPALLPDSVRVRILAIDPAPPKEQ